MTKQLTNISEYERYLLHRALWVWCAESGESKIIWPGWQVVDKSKIFASCFICPLIGTEISCDDGSSIMCKNISIGCLNGLFPKSIISINKLEITNNWINRRAYQLACYRIAFVPWKVQPTPTVGEYRETLLTLESVYGETPVAFVPTNDKDYLRFIRSGGA